MQNCQYLNLTNPVENGVFLGATLWVSWNSPHLKRPGTNLYLNLWQYLFKYAKIRSRAAKFCPDGGKLFNKTAAQDPESVWYPWRDADAIDGCLGDDDWGQGASAGEAGSWARWTRLFTAQTPDLSYADGWIARLQKVCNGDFGDPISLSDTDPTLLVDEDVDPGYVQMYD